MTAPAAPTAALDADGLVKTFPSARSSRSSRSSRSRLFRPAGAGPVQAVSGVSLRVEPGRTLGLVGESGCGKSTVGRLLVRLAEPDRGRVRVGGADLTTARGSELRSLRRRVQMVFQDPAASLDPRASAAASIAEPLRIAGWSPRRIDDRVVDLVDLVGLDRAHGVRYPHELSGGQLQRVAIARALAPEPMAVVLDEAVSALDVSVRAGVINQLVEIQDRTGVAYVFIGHDLGVVRHISHDVAVMYLGKVIEHGPVDAVFERPAHPYTAALLDAVPVPDPRAERARRRVLLDGDVPSPADPPSGCRFRTRCPVATSRCAAEEPALRSAPDGHAVACHLAAPTFGTSGPLPRSG